LPKVLEQIGCIGDGEGSTFQLDAVFGCFSQVVIVAVEELKILKLNLAIAA
jgi:hypothetical protein